MQRFVLSVLFALALNLTTVGAAEPSSAPTPEVDNGLSGYKNLQTGEWQISPRFQSALRFEEGYAVVQSTDTNGWGVIDLTGEWVVEPYLTNLDYSYPSFYQGILWFAENEENRSCPVVFRIRDGEAQQVVECGTYDHIHDYSGDTTEPDPIDGLSHSQMAAVAKDGKWGYINRAGQLVIAMQYASAGDFAHNFAVVERDGKMGAIDMKGALIVPTDFENIKALGRHSIAVQKDGKWGLYKADGSLLTAPAYDDIFIDDDQPMLIKLNNKWGFLDQQGKVIIQPQFDGGDTNWHNGMTVVTIQSKKGIIDATGQWLFKPEFEDLSVGSVTYASAKREGKWGVIDRNSNWIVPPEAADSNYEWSSFQATTADGLQASAGTKSGRQCYFADGRVVSGDECEGAEITAALMDMLQKRGYSWAVPMIAGGLSIGTIGEYLLGLLVFACPVLTTVIWVRKKLPNSRLMRPSWLARSILVGFIGIVGFYLLLVGLTFVEVASHDDDVYNFDQYLTSSPFSTSLSTEQWLIWGGLSFVLALVFSIPGSIWRLVRWWRARHTELKMREE